MSTTYSDYNRDRIGWFFELSGWQPASLAASALPVAISLQHGAWATAMLFTGIWVMILLITVVPVRSRSATGWFLASTAFTVGRLAGWTSWRSKASTGQVEDLADADLPGVLQGIEVHDGPPQGPELLRVAIIQNHAAKTWAVTAAMVHPGIGMRDAQQRDRGGLGLSELLDLASRTELIDEVLIVVRTVPDDGAERDMWITRRRRDGGPSLSRKVNDDLRQRLTGASVRTEAFVTIVVPETRIARAAKECGGGVEGRARVLYGLIGEVESQLRGGMGMTQVTWLTSPELAVACRTGFAPADRAQIVEALAARVEDSNTNADVPWAMPSVAESAVRFYSHDAWNSVSSTIELPAKGSVIGALAPVLTPGQAGERRSFLAAFPILQQSAADRRTANSEWAADLGEELRRKAKVKQRAKSGVETAKARGVDAKLARGSALTRPYAVCTVTVPKTGRVTEFGRRLDYASRKGRRSRGRGWAAAKAKVLTWRMTSDQAPVLWPFITTPPALPPTGAQMGIDLLSGGSFYPDPHGWVLEDSVPVTNPNMFIFGKPGRGKSATVKALLLRMMDFDYRALILGDPKDEYQLLCRALGVEPFAIGPGLPTRINPLSFGPLGDGWDRLSAEQTQGRTAIMFGRWLTLLRGLVGSQRIGEHRVPFGPSDEVVVKAALQEGGVGFRSHARELRGERRCTIRRCPSRQRSKISTSRRRIGTRFPGPCSPASAWKKPGTGATTTPAPPAPKG